MYPVYQEAMLKMIVLDTVALQLMTNLVVQGSYGFSRQCPYRICYAACLTAYAIGYTTGRC